MTIAIDFDGVCVSNEFPKMGKDIGAVPVLSELVAKGHKLILLTNRYGQSLKDAENWFMAYGIPLYGVNRNPVQCVFPKARKFMQIYISMTGG